MWCPFSTNPQTILPLAPFLSNIHPLTLPPSSCSVSLAVSDPGPVTERRSEQLLCVHSSHDGVIQQKSNRQRPSPSLHLSLHLRLSLLFVDQMLPVCSPLCPSLVWLIAGFLFLDSQGYSLFTGVNINQSRIYNKSDPYISPHICLLGGNLEALIVHWLSLTSHKETKRLQNRGVYCSVCCRFNSYIRQITQVTSGRSKSCV